MSWKIEIHECNNLENGKQENGSSSELTSQIKFMRADFSTTFIKVYDCSLISKLSTQAEHSFPLLTS